ncbi:PFL-like glycyl radical enzyme, partial [Panus rudis PR-1116 ss-1]
LASDISGNLATYHPDYAMLGGRLEVARLHSITTPKFTKYVADAVCSLCHIHMRHLDGTLSAQFGDIVKKHGEVLNDALVHKRDFDFSYMAIKTLQHSYLVKSQGKIAERPQYMYMRVSLAVHGRELPRVLEAYNLMSKGYYTHASPTLFNAGREQQQLSSCFLLDIADFSMNGVYDSLKDTAIISASAGGLGINLDKLPSQASHSIRPENVGYMGGTAIVGVAKLLDATSRFATQGGEKRPGAMTLYLPDWHLELPKFIPLKSSLGQEEMRARNLFYAVFVSDLFMKRVISDGSWTLFCPTSVPGLAEAYGIEFKSLYESYERLGMGLAVRARDIWQQMLNSQIETGGPFLLYKDSINRE